MSLEPRDSAVLCEIMNALMRIATALERQCQAFPPLPPVVVSEVPRKEEPKTSKDELVTKVTNDTISNMHYKGRQLFYNCGFCDQACPKNRSCVEYQPGEECIGWRTPRYKGA
jgi:hypothetical protein